jgi:DNA invertase Pin-like site-specific DNA recombinase
MVRFQPKPQQPVIDTWSTQLPTDVLWGIYARQSTPGQLVKYTESTEMQTDDLIEWLRDRHVQDNNIVLFDADLGLSGTLRIDERSDLRELVRRINADEIKAVLVYQISRLFRDLTGIQYNTFAEDCRQHNCILVTAYDGMVFNFNNPIHLKMFRFLAETAAEYLQQQIGLLHEARLRKARKGLYVGNIPSGFVVDYDKDSPTFQKIVPYGPHKEIILEKLYRRYYELCGDFSALCREIDSMPYVFPLFESWVDIRITNLWKRRLKNGGYSLTRKGIITVMTNPVNIGWWIVAGDIISKNNHERIIPPEEEYLFWYAFDRLAVYNTNGERNENRIVNYPKRFYHKTTDPTEGLLKDRISSPDGKVRVHLKSGSQHYAIYPPHNIYVKDMHEIDANLIDCAFTSVFFEHLKETHDFDDYQKWVSKEVAQHDELIANLTKQLAQADKTQIAALDEIVAIRAKINETAKSEEDKKRLEKEAEPYIAKLREKYNVLEGTKKILAEKLEKAQKSEHHKALRQYADFQTEVKKLIPVWEKKPLSVRKEFVNLFVDKVVLRVVAPHWVQLDIIWTHPQWEAQRLYIMRSHGPRPLWSSEEKSILAEHYAQTDRIELLQLLPGKTWASMIQQAKRMGLTRVAQTRTPLSISRDFSWEDILFMQERHIPLDAEGPICISLADQESEDEAYEEELATCPNCEDESRPRPSPPPSQPSHAPSTRRCAPASWPISWDVPATTSSTTSPAIWASG